MLKTSLCACTHVKVYTRAYTNLCNVYGMICITCECVENDFVTSFRFHGYTSFLSVRADEQTKKNSREITLLPRNKMGVLFFSTHVGIPYTCCVVFTRFFKRAASFTHFYIYIGVISLNLEKCKMVICVYACHYK